MASHCREAETLAAARSIRLGAGDWEDSRRASAFLESWFYSPNPEEAGSASWNAATTAVAAAAAAAVAEAG